MKCNDINIFVAEKGKCL